MLKAIVFDFDGVIANSEPLHYRAFRDVLAAAGPGLSEQDYYGRYLGYDDVGVFRAVAPTRGPFASQRTSPNWSPTRPHRIEECSNAIFRSLFEGAEDAIRRAAAAVPLRSRRERSGPRSVVC